MSNDFELLGRLLLAAVLGGAIGAERELNDRRPACGPTCS
jgi:uncharacterized membrane protein YhiD involved in acid resistance